MSKTTEQIAKDCGLSEFAANRISEILKDGGPTFDGSIIGSLYRRIEKLEEEKEAWLEREAEIDAGLRELEGGHQV